MKKVLTLAFLLTFLFLSSAFAQDALQKALDNFHQTLAFTYHPMADDSNFAPIKSRSQELSQKAEEVEKAFQTVKEAYKVIEPSIEQLLEQCEALDAVIKKGATDDAIRTRLSSIHDKFHEIESSVSKLNGQH